MCITWDICVHFDCVIKVYSSLPCCGCIVPAHLLHCCCLQMWARARVRVFPFRAFVVCQMSWRHVWSRSVKCNFTISICMCARLQTNTNTQHGIIKRSRKSTKSGTKQHQRHHLTNFWGKQKKGHFGPCVPGFRADTISVLSTKVTLVESWREAFARAWTCLFM